MRITGAMGGGFSQGLAQAMGALLPVMVQQRLAESGIEERKKEFKLKEQMMELQQKTMEMSLQEHLQKLVVGAAIGTQIESMGQTPGQPLGYPGETPGATGPPEVSPRAKLASLMARSGQTKEALSLMPEVTEPPPELMARRAQAQMGAMRPLLQEMGVTQPGQGAAPSPAPAPAAPATLGGSMMPGPAPGQAMPAPPSPQMTFQPTLNVGKDGAISLSIQGQRTNFQLSQFTKDTPDGPQIFERVFDPVGGRVINEYAIGRPAAPQKLEELSQTITNAWGIPRSSPFHGRILGALTLLEQLPPEQRALAVQKLDAEIKTLTSRPGGQAGLTAPGTNIMGPTPGVPGMGAATGGLSSPGDIAESAGAAARAQELTQTEAKTRAGEIAKREESPVSPTIQTRVNFFKDTRSGLATIKETYNPAFVGKGFEPFIAGTQSEFQKMLSQITKNEAAGNPNSYMPGAFAGAARLYVGTASEEETRFRKSILDVSDLILRARSGAQINEQEAKRLQAMLFTVTDSPKVFEAALKRFEQSVNTSIESTLSGAITSPKSQLQQERARQEPVGIPMPRFRVSPDGRWERKP